MQRLVFILLLWGNMSPAAEPQIHDIIYTNELGGRLLRQVTTDDTFHIEECKLEEDNGYFSKYEGKRIQSCQKITPNYINDQHAIDALNFGFASHLDQRLSAFADKAAFKQKIFFILAIAGLGGSVQQSIYFTKHLYRQSDWYLPSEERAASDRIVRSSFWKLPGLFLVTLTFSAIEIYLVGTAGHPSLESVLKKGSRNAENLTGISTMSAETLYQYCLDSLIDTEKDLQPYQAEI
jgi:hypothetical protein